MACKNLKAPTPPTMENLPDGINLPKGMSIDSLKQKASGTGLSDAMNNAGDMIGSGLKNLGAQLSPTALAAKVGEAINGAASTITGMVKGAIDGVTNLKDRITSFDPSMDKLKSGVKGKITGKIGGIGEFAGIQASISLDKCNNKYIKEAGQANKGLKDTAAAAVAGMSNKERAEALKDPTKMAALQSQTEKQVTDQAKNNAMATATTADKSERTAQDKLQSETLQTQDKVSKNAEYYIGLWCQGPGFFDYFDSMLYYAAAISGRRKDFDKFGFFGINRDDANNALLVPQHIAEETVARVYSKTIVAAAAYDLAEDPVGKGYQEALEVLGDIKSINGQTIVNKDTKLTFEKFLTTTRDLFNSDFLGGLHQAPSYNSQFTNYAGALVGYFLGQFIPGDFDPYKPRDVTSVDKVKADINKPGDGQGVLSWKLTPANRSDMASWKSTGLPTTSDISWHNTNSFWVTRDDDDIDYYGNYKKVLEKKREYISETIQQQKDDTVKFLKDRGVDTSIINKVEATNGDASKYIIYVVPKLCPQIAQTVCIDWDPITGVVKSVKNVECNSIVKANFEKRDNFIVWQSNDDF